MNQQGAVPAEVRHKGPKSTLGLQWTSPWVVSETLWAETQIKWAAPWTAPRLLTASHNSTTVGRKCHGFIMSIVAQQKWYKSRETAYLRLILRLFFPFLSRKSVWGSCKVCLQCNIQNITVNNIRQQIYYITQLTYHILLLYLHLTMI